MGHCFKAERSFALRMVLYVSGFPYTLPFILCIHSSAWYKAKANHSPRIPNQLTVCHLPAWNRSAIPALAFVACARSTTPMT